MSGPLHVLVIESQSRALGVLLAFSGSFSRGSGACMVRKIQQLNSIQKRKMKKGRDGGKVGWQGAERKKKAKEVQGLN